MYCIYRVTNNINGRTYIGQHKYSNEKNPMGRYRGGGSLLRRAYDKYGIENFSIEVLYKRIRDRETSDSMEIWMIAKERKENKNGCYNIAEGGYGGFVTCWNRGKKGCFSVEARRKMSEAHKGKPAWNKGNRYSTGKRWKASEETKKKLSDSHKGQIAWNKGKKLGHWYNNGIKSVVAEECPDGFTPGRLYTGKGRVFSEEHKQNLAKAWKRRKEIGGLK